jgi:hypothetical protein
MKWSAGRLPAMLAMLLALSATSTASAADWAANYGGLAGANAYTKATAVDASGNVYLAGYFDGTTFTLGSVTLTRIGTQDAFVAKLNASGAVLWAKNFGGSGANATGNAIAVDGSGNVYLGGNFTMANLTTPALTKIGTQDAFAIKLDSIGAFTWAKNFGGSGANASGLSVAVDNSGNVYLGGDFSGANLTTPVLTKIGTYDAFAIKLVSTGATTWAKNFGGSGAQAFGQGIAVDSTGNVYLVGYFGAANLTTPALTEIGTYIGAYDAFAIKLDSTGATTWAKNFGGSGAGANGYSITVDGSGNVYLGGYLYTGNLTTPALTKIGTQDAFVIKLDSTGATTWAKNFGGSGAQAFGNGIAVDNAGNIYLGGYFNSANLTTPALTKIGTQDAFAIKLSSTGVTTWAKNFGGSGAAANGDGIAVDGSGNVYLGGYFQGANLTTPALTKIGRQDAFAFKLDSTGATTWAKNFGGLTPRNASTQATAVDASGNVYLAGYFDGETFTLGSVTLTRIGSQDAFVAKMDASGAVLWAKNFGGSGATTYGQSIAVDGSGNVYLGGYFIGANLTTPALTMIGTDAFALKLDSTGAITWAKNFGGSGGAGAFGNGIAVDGSGNVYLGGYFTGANLTTPALTKIGNQDAFAIKLSSTGATTWAKNFGGLNSNVWSYGIAVDGSGNVYLGGYFNTANLTTPALTKIGNQDAFAIKLDSTGATTWAKNFGGSGAVAFGRSIANDNSGNVYLGGYFQGANLTTPALTRIGFQDAFAIKLSSTGAFIWAKNFGGSGGAFASGQSIAVDGSGNVYLGGAFMNANLTTPALTWIGNYDAFALKLDSTGATTWAKNFGGSGAATFGQSITNDGSGNVYLGGYFQSANLTTPALTKIGNQDAYIIVTTTYRLTYTAGANGSISGASPQTVSYGGSASAVTAVPDANYFFMNWTGTNGFVTTTANPLTVTNVTSNMTITANFALDAPVAAFTASPNPAACGQTISFNGTGSYHNNPSRTIVNYSWNFGDGTAKGTGVTTTHGYSHFGTYTAALTVTDDNVPAKTDMKTVIVTVNQGNQAPVANAGGPYYRNQGTGLFMSAAGSSDPDSACGDSVANYEWDLNNDGAYDISGSDPTVSLTWAQMAAYAGLQNLGAHTIRLRVTDSFGATNTVTATLTIYNDPTPPTTTATASGYTFGTWTTTSPSSVTMSADDGSGSGTTAGYPKYCVDTTNTCTPSTSYVSAFDVTCASGSVCTQYVRYYAVDNVGNTETIKSSTIEQDLQKPVTTPSVVGGLYNSAQSVTLGCYDNSGSGCANTSYCTGAGCTPGTTYASAIFIATSTVLRYASIDAAGNSEPVSSQTYTIDTTSPALAVSTLADGSRTNDATLNISGSTSDENGIQSLVISGQSVTVQPDNTFSYATTLTTGANIITTTATDSVGNTTTDTRTITLDQTAPGVTVTSPADNSFTNFLTTAVTGTVDETVQSVLVSIGTTTISADVVGNIFSAPTVTLSYGLNTINIYATDIAGNTTSAKRTVTYDDVSPSLAITSPNQDLSTNQASITVSGTISDITAVTMLVTCPTASVGLVTNPTATSWQVDITNMTPGTNTITVAATDAANNSTSVIRNIIYDTTPPALTINPVSTPTNVNTQTITGTMELNSSMTVTCPTALISAVITTDTTWSVSLTNMTQGTNTITAMATDAAGNTATATTSIFLDTASPVGTIVLDNGAPLTKHTTVSVHLEAMDNNGIIGYYLSENPAIPGVSDPLWSAVTSTLTFAGDTTFALSVGDGPKTVYAWFKDISGNISASAGVSITLASSGSAFSTTEVSGMAVSMLPDGSHTSDATLNVTGNVADLGDLQAIIVGSDPVTINPDGSFSVAVPLIPGDNLVQITIIDAAGNQSTVSRTITLDPLAPALAITSPADGILTARNYIDITGTMGENVTVAVSLNNGSTQAALMSTMTFTATVNPLNAGLNTIVVLATGPTGSTQTAKRTVFYDFRKPGLSVTSPDKDVTITDGTMNLTGVISDALTAVTVTISVDGKVYNPEVINDNFTQALTFDKEGIYPVIVTATDENGNSSWVQRNIRYQRGNIVINKGAVATTSTTVNLDLSYVSAPTFTISTMQLLYNNTAWTTPMAFAAKKTITLPAGDVVKTVFVRFIDKTGAVSSFYSDTIILDTKAPLGSITINNGDAVTISATVTLGLAVTDVNGVVKMQFSDNGTTWTTPESFATTRHYTLPGAYGAKKVYARFIDGAGKVSAAVSDTITYAASPTVSDSEYVVIKNGDKYTTATSVPVAITNPNPATYTQMRTSMNGMTWALWQNIASSKTVTVILPAGDGVKTVYVQCKTPAGNTTPTYSGSIILDTVAPTGSIQINNGAYSTSDRNVTLTLAASDLNGVKSMQTSTNNLDWATRTWEPFNGTKAITLPTGEGVKTVWVKYKDNAGKVSAAYSDTILVDTLAPTGKALINGGAKVITSRLVTLSFSATGATYLRLSLDNGATWGDWEPYVASKKVTLPSGDGTKTVQVYFRDLTGNVSLTPASASASYSQVMAPDGITVPNSSPAVNYQVSWGTSTTTGVTYVLQEATNADFTAGLRTAYSGLLTSANITSRVRGRIYYYRVQAKKTGYESSPQTVGANGCTVGM